MVMMKNYHKKYYQKNKELYKQREQKRMGKRCHNCDEVCYGYLCMKCTKKIGSRVTQRRNYAIKKRTVKGY